MLIKIHEYNSVIPDTHQVLLLYGTNRVYSGSKKNDAIHSGVHNCKNGDESEFAMNLPY
jgi:hypothetical protein